MKESLQKDESYLLGKQIVLSLLTRHQVPERQRSNWIEKILGLSYHAAHRRVNGLLPWTIDELDKVAAHFGETVVSAVLAFHAEQAKSAQFVVGGVQEPCDVWIGEPVGPTHQTSLVAQESTTGWVVKPYTGVTTDDTLVFTVVRIMFEPKKARKTYRIAVLDDSPDVAQNVSDYLRRLGFTKP
jgi:hypothetical protein